MNSAALILAILATLGAIVIDVMCRLKAYTRAGRRLGFAESAKMAVNDEDDRLRRLLQVALLARLVSYIGIVVVVAKLAAL